MIFKYFISQISLAIHIIFMLFQKLYKITRIAVFFPIFKDSFSEQELQTNVLRVFIEKA